MKFVILICVIVAALSQQQRKSIGQPKNQRNIDDSFSDQTAVECSSIENQAVESYLNASGSLQTAASNLQTYLTAKYPGNWAVLYSTNFGITFIYVTPNLCEFSLADGVYCALFQEPPSQ